MQVPFDREYLLSNFQNLRILQIHILFVHGLRDEVCANLETILSQDYGPIAKITFQAIHNNFNSAFVTFWQEVDASKALLGLKNSSLNQSKILRVYYGSTKFCPNYLYDRPCQLADCNYAHYYIPQLTFFKKNLKCIDHSLIAEYVLGRTSFQQKESGNFLCKEEKGSIEPLNSGFQISRQYETKSDSHQPSIPSQSPNLNRSARIKNSNEPKIQQIDWMDISKEINGYLKTDKERQIKADCRTKVQKFLDQAETKLLSLIFKFNYLSA